MKKIAIAVSGLESPLRQRAVGALSEALTDYTNEYPICTDEDNTEVLSECRCIYIGTRRDCDFIRRRGLTLPEHAEGYCISVKDDTVVIEGCDEAGVLYGCLDFYNKYITLFEFPHNLDMYRVNIFEHSLPDFEYSSYPSVKNRGIWTWGHVLYDWRQFIDNMLKLKMNTLVVWNDFVPVNAREMVEYAHSCGIKLIWGYSWCWGVECAKSFGTATEQMSEEIFRQYERDYADLGGDGIYFQSFTELNTQKIGDMLIAEAVTEFVNKTAARFYEKYPDLELQFGLHATSVNENLSFIKDVDKRIRIVWEDCGSFPFSYIPADTADFDKTMDFVKEISYLRGKSDKLGFVTKGFTKLDWSNFEHLNGPVYAGKSSKRIKRERIERKSKIWKYLQSYWLTECDKAYTAVRTAAELKNDDLYITPLVEDGCFEENIMYPVALFAEMLWDCRTPLKKLINEVALRDYIDFA